jgi:hypothetical protein
MLHIGSVQILMHTLTPLYEDLLMTGFEISHGNWFSMSMRVKQVVPHVLFDWVKPQVHFQVFRQCVIEVAEVGVVECSCSV